MPERTLDTATPSARLAPYLRPGERLLWSGRPDPDVTFTAADVYLIPFSLLWAGFVVVWELTAITEVDGGAGWLFPLWGIPFVLVGAYMLVGRFFAKRRRKRKTVYGVTDERALVAVGDDSLSDSPIRHVPVSRRRSRDGHLSVTFGSAPSGSSKMYANSGMELMSFRSTNLVAFYDVADADGLSAALDQAAA
ncbi:MAG: hypothetical protein JWQ18_2530, partial [Conexibacter sp.]|nr:hypothetical protein [Conexibacter sp.]